MLIDNLEEAFSFAHRLPTKTTMKIMTMVATTVKDITYLSTSATNISVFTFYSSIQNIMLLTRISEFIKRVFFLRRFSERTPWLFHRFLNIRLHSSHLFAYQYTGHVQNKLNMNKNEERQINFSFVVIKKPRQCNAGSYISHNQRFYSQFI